MHNIMLYTLHISFYLKLIKSIGWFFLVYLLEKLMTNRPFHVEVNRKATLLHPSSNILIAKR